MRNFKKIFLKTEVILIQFFFYVGGLIYFLLRGYSWWYILILHLIFVLFYGILYFKEDFSIFLFAPAMAVFIPINNYRLKKYLRDFKQDVPAEVVIILGQSNFFKLKSWIKINFLRSEIKCLVEYLNAKKQDFSFYPKASIKDVEKIMSDKSIKEVYFFGHGDSHTFQLNTGEILYYCEFNDMKKYGKVFAHQVHCGTSYGKSLIDYVVPEENRSKCFLFRKPINSFDIAKEFKRRTKNIPEKK